MGEWRWDILTGVAESVGLCSWRLKEGDRVLSALTTPRAGLQGVWWACPKNWWKQEVCFCLITVHDRLITAKAFKLGVSPPPHPTFALAPPLVRRVKHLVFVRRLRCISLVIAGEHLSAFARLERRLWGTKWPHPVYIFIIARLTYLLTSGKNLQVNLLGSFSKE